MSEIKRIVLAYSGGLDTSVILKWLMETYKAEVICYCGDVGQEEDLEGVREKALATGARDYLVSDLREEFVRDFVFPAVAANAIYEGTYLLGTSLARPVLAKEQVRIAREFDADAVAHGCTGKGNDQMRFELTFQALAPDLEIIAPWRDWDLGGRTELMAYAKKYEIPVEATLKKPYSIDRNLLHVSYEGGVLEDPWHPPEEKMWGWTRSVQDAPETPAQVVIEFERGVPVAVDGNKLGPVELLTRLNDLGAEHGVGRVDMVEDRAVGMKARGCYETPGGTLLYAAHRALESITLDREVMLERDRLIPRIAQLIYNGFWYSPEMEFLRAAVDKSQEHVSGEVRLQLYKGGLAVLGRRSDETLYSEEIATFEADDAYDQSDATGFIRLNALRLKLRSPTR
ncbi:MAG: argininosuccinate synthase [bacterium]|nr:argininosuccinate synthase [bacterium]